MKKAISILSLTLMIVSAFPSLAGTVPLPAWSFSGVGNGSWNWSSLGVSQVGLTAFGPSSGQQSETALATSSKNVLIVTTNTSYALSASSTVSGPGGGAMKLLVNGAIAANTDVPTTGSNIGNVPYSASFTTTGAGDSRVGLPLKAQFNASGGVGGGATATFTNITLTATTVTPQLFIRNTNSTQVRLSWSTNFNWYVMESATALNSGVWSPAGGAPVTEGSELVILQTRQPGRQYFRLRQP